jgi:hypothetical protein
LPTFSPAAGVGVLSEIDVVDVAGGINLKATEAFSDEVLVVLSVNFSFLGGR